MEETRDRVPAHLKRFVVHQDHDAYTAVDHAVWRFILLQTYARLKKTAHPAYAQGLARTGMTVDRIPRISEMDARLSEFGWGAVCVDGFIPPRAFQEFQAMSILPIAAEIRTVAHLAYTPAPDIVHEAAGHAPILPDPGYAAFLRRIGRMGMGAFTRPNDTLVYEAIYELSVAKETRKMDQVRIEAAEAQLARALGSAGELSEAARLARLYWWTVEYGLVGSPREYRLYGAGLLSSLAESFFCHEATVEKLPLSAACVDTDYDITTRQPQLFVAEDFEHLMDVLDDVTADYSMHVGGSRGLRLAVDSEEVATVQLESGLQVTGTLAELWPQDTDPALVRLAGPCAVSQGGLHLDGQGTETHADGMLLWLGRLEDGRELAHLSVAALEEFSINGRLDLRHEAGLSLECRLERSDRWSDGLLQLGDVALHWGGALLIATESVWLAFGKRAAQVHAGAADPHYWPQTPPSIVRVPKPAQLGVADQRLLELYQQAQGCVGKGSDGRMLATFTRVHEVLCAQHPHDWLLRWNLLESLKGLQSGSALASRLANELRVLEGHYDGRSPIAVGLRYLDIDPTLRRRT